MSEINENNLLDDTTDITGETDIPDTPPETGTVEPGGNVGNDQPGTGETDIPDTPPETGTVEPGGNVDNDPQDTPATTSTTVVQDLQRATAGINDIETALLATGAIQSGETCPIEDMDDAIRSLEKALAPKSITSNGTYDPASDNLDGYSQVTVNVQDTHGTKSITENGIYNAIDDGVDGYSQVTVAVPSTQPVLGTKSISANGEYNASSDSLDGYSSVTVYINDTGKITVDLDKDTIAINLKHTMEKVAIALGFSGTPSTSSLGQEISLNLPPANEASNVGLDFAGLHNSDYRTAKTNDKISFAYAYGQTTGLFEGWTDFFVSNVEDDQQVVDKLKFGGLSGPNMFKGATFKNNSVDLRWLEFTTNMDVSNMFMNCSTLQSITGFDMSKIYTVTDMFYGCTALQHLTALSGTTLGGQSMGVNIDLSEAAHLDIMEFINSLATSPIAWEGGYSTITVHAAVFATLTAEDLATIANKHYKVVAQ